MKVIIAEGTPSSTPTDLMWILVTLAHREEIRLSRHELFNANPKALIESFWQGDEYVIRIKK